MAGNLEAVWHTCEACFERVDRTCHWVFQKDSIHLFAKPPACGPCRTQCMSSSLEQILQSDGPPSRQRSLDLQSLARRAVQQIPGNRKIGQCTALLDNSQVGMFVTIQDESTALCVPEGDCIPEHVAMTRASARPSSFWMICSTFTSQPPPASYQRYYARPCKCMELAVKATHEDHYLRDATELPQWGLGPPHAVIDHEAQSVGLGCQVGPATPQAHLKQAAHQPACTLGDVHHV